MGAARRVLAVVGRVLVSAGVLLLLFTAYQIWGTALAESHSQAQLRGRIDREIPATVRLDAPRPKKGPPAVAPTVAQPAEGQPLGILRIPAIGLDQVIVQGVGDADLEKGPGHYPSTPLPGEAGNAAIAGHRTTWGHPFYDLNAVAPGAHVEVTTAQGSFTFTTKRVFVVSPDDNSVLAPTPGASLTLTTCNPRYSAAQRLVLRAELTASSLSGGVVPGSGRPSRSFPSDQLAGSTSGNWWTVAAWGVAVAGAMALVWRLAHRRHRRWPVYLLGLPGLLVLLYFFFESVTPQLPASF